MAKQSINGQSDLGINVVNSPRTQLNIDNFRAIGKVQSASGLIFCQDLIMVHEQHRTDSMGLYRYVDFEVFINIHPITRTNN